MLSSGVSGKLDEMKFGHNLSRNQVPEWTSAYINYKGLKKLIKSASEASRQDGSADTAGKLTQARRELGVNGAYLS